MDNQAVQRSPAPGKKKGKRKEMQIDDMAILSHMKLYEIRLGTMVRPQGKSNCSLCCIASACRFLFHKHELTPSDVAKMIGLPDLSDSPKLGELATNERVLEWFRLCCSTLGHDGIGDVLVAPYRNSNEPEKRLTRNPSEALSLIKEYLSSPKHYVIYHLLNHYAPVLGVLSCASTECSTLIVGESVESLPLVHYVPYKEVITDLSIDLPNYINPRAMQRPWAVKKWSGAVTENIHALLCFRII